MERIEDIIIDIDNKQLQENIELHEGFLSALKNFGKGISTAGKYVSGVLHHKKIGDISKEIYNNNLKQIKDLDTAEKQVYADIDFILATLESIQTKDGKTYDIEQPSKAINDFISDYKSNKFIDDNKEYAEYIQSFLSKKMIRKIESIDNDNLKQYQMNGKSIKDYLADLQNKGSVSKYIKQYGKKGTDPAEIVKIKGAILLLKRIYVEIAEPLDSRQYSTTNPLTDEEQNILFNKTSYLSGLTTSLNKVIDTASDDNVKYHTKSGQTTTLKQFIRNEFKTIYNWQGINLLQFTEDDIFNTLVKYKKYFVGNLLWHNSPAFGTYFSYVPTKIKNTNNVEDFKRAALAFFISVTLETIEYERRGKASKVNSYLFKIESLKDELKSSSLTDDEAAKIHSKIKYCRDEIATLQGNQDSESQIQREVTKIYTQLVQGQSLEDLISKLDYLVHIQPDSAVKGGYVNQLLSTYVEDYMKLCNISEVDYSTINNEQSDNTDQSN